MMSRKPKVIMIDAFKPAYLEHAPYLKSLTEKNQWGELDMGLGHWRGVEILFKGKSEVIAIFYKNKNSLSYFRYFKWLEWFGNKGRIIVNVLFNIPRLLKGYELFKTGNIPLDILSKMDVSIKKHEGKKNIDFFYFGELDNLGHKYGTKSFEVSKAIRKIDKEVSEMDFDLIFSDHGMVDVEKMVSVPITKNCFIDSDMARYWGGNKELMMIRNKLPLEYGKIIEWDEKYGQLIFLIDTGKLIFPNFWDKKPVRAMHGYDGKHEDMKAFYLLNKVGEKKNLKTEELHELLNEIKSKK